mgnify:CR=1 FL=1
MLSRLFAWFRKPAPAALPLPTISSDLATLVEENLRLGTEIDEKRLRRKQLQAQINAQIVLRDTPKGGK